MNVKHETAKIVILVSFIVAFAVSAYYYPQLPERMASHWDFAGNVNGYMPRIVGAFMMPVLIAFMTFLLLAVPNIDPLKKNYTEKFRQKYTNFAAILAIFLLMLHVQILLWNSGLRISINTTLPLGIGMIVYYTGVLCQHAEKRNWFIGIRTPWSMSSDRVWKKTNQLGGKLLKVAGVIAVLGVLADDYSIFFVFVPIVAAVTYAVIYSYAEYNKK